MLAIRPIVAGILSALAVSAAANTPPKSQQVAQDAPPPIPDPVEEYLTDAAGRPVAVLVFRMREGQPPARRFTIAQQRWIGGRIAILPPGRRQVTMRCAVAEDGTVVEPSACIAEGVADDYARDTFQHLGRLLRPALPAMAAAGVGSPERVLRYTVSLDRAAWPGVIPFWTGRSLDRPVDAPLIALLHRQLRDDWPDLAVTLRLEARVTLQCFVESDRSVSCRVAAVEPSVVQPYFAAGIASILPRGRLPERLRDGTATLGLVFTAQFEYLIGNER